MIELFELQMGNTSSNSKDEEKVKKTDGNAENLKQSESAQNNDSESAQNNDSESAQNNDTESSDYLQR